MQPLLSMKQIPSNARRAQTYRKSPVALTPIHLGVAAPADERAEAQAAQLALAVYALQARAQRRRRPAGGACFAAAGTAVGRPETVEGEAVRECRGPHLGPHGFASVWLGADLNGGRGHVHHCRKDEPQHFLPWHAEDRHWVIESPCSFPKRLCVPQKSRPCAAGASVAGSSGMQGRRQPWLILGTQGARSVTAR